MLYRLLFLPVIALFFLSLTACSDDENSGPKLTNLQVTASQNPVAAGYRVWLTATAFFDDGSSYDTDASWTSLNPDIASVDYDSGIVTTYRAGRALIQAEASGGIGEIALQVTEAELERIELSPAEASTPIGLDIGYDAQGYFSDGSSHSVMNEPSLRWQSSNPGVATVDPQTGMSETFSEGTTEIIASLGGVQSNTASLTVNSAVVQNFVISPESVGLPLGQTQPFTAEVTLSDGSRQDVTDRVTWVSDDPTVVELVENAGVFKGVSEGVGEISANYQEQFFSDAPASFAVEPRELESFSIDSPTGADTIPLGKAEQFTATAEFSDGAEYDVSGYRQVFWQSSDPSVLTVSLSGEVTAVSQGLATISALTAIDKVRASKFMQVTEPVLESIIVEPVDGNPILSEGLTQQYDAKARFTDGSIQDEIESEAGFTWRAESSILGDPFSTPPTVSISDTGLLTYDDTGRFPGFSNVHGSLNELSGVTTLLLPYAELLVVDSLSPTAEFVGVLTAVEADQLSVAYSRIIREDLGFNEYVDYVLMSFEEAEDHCDGLLYNGYSDWRLPTSAELVALWQEVDGSADVFTFSKGWVFSRNYWSATPTDDGHETVSLLDASLVSAEDDSRRYASCVRFVQ